MAGKDIIIHADSVIYRLIEQTKADYDRMVKEISPRYPFTPISSAQMLRIVLTEYLVRIDGEEQYKAAMSRVYDNPGGPLI